MAIVGAGGIGFDVAEFLTAGESADGHASDGRADDPAIAAFRAEWGIDSDYATRGGLKLAAKPGVPSPFPRSPRQLWLLQRKSSKVGESLGATEKKQECVVSGGVGTMTVSYKGETFYVCCSGCRDEFNANPEKYVKEWKAKKGKN